MRQMNTINSEKIYRLNSMLESAERIVIATHMKPDGDAVGSSMGMYHTLKVYGKSAKIAFTNPAPASISFLTEGNQDILIYEDMKDETEKAILEADLIICLDFNAFHRTDTLESALTRSEAEKILIDHHLSPDLDSFSLAFSETEISSASELLYHVLMELPPIGGNAKNFPIDAATAIMTGMTTDTNNFMNSTYPSTLRMASSLLEVGVDRDMIIQNVYNSFKEGRIRLQGHVLKDLLNITQDGVAYIVLDKEAIRKYNIQDGDTEGFVNIPLSIKGVFMSIFIKEDEDRVRVSIRSRKGTSANRCAKKFFNGGGHENAAGGRLYIPQDIASINDAAAYIERTTHIFMTEENE
jgi:phosphoesterase RecJ-like protein